MEKLGLTEDEAALKKVEVTNKFEDGGADAAEGEGDILSRVAAATSKGKKRTVCGVARTRVAKLTRDRGPATAHHSQGALPCLRRIIPKVLTLLLSQYREAEEGEVSHSGHARLTRVPPVLGAAMLGRRLLACRRGQSLFGTLRGATVS